MRRILSFPLLGCSPNSARCSALLLTCTRLAVSAHSRPLLSQPASTVEASVILPSSPNAHRYDSDHLPACTSSLPSAYGQPSIYTVINPSGEVPVSSVVSASYHQLDQQPHTSCQQVSVRQTGGDRATPRAFMTSAKHLASIDNVYPHLATQPISSTFNSSHSSTFSSASTSILSTAQDSVSDSEVSPLSYSNLTAGSSSSDRSHSLPSFLSNLIQCDGRQSLLPTTSCDLHQNTEDEIMGHDAQLFTQDFSLSAGRETPPSYVPHLQGWVHPFNTPWPSTETLTRESPTDTEPSENQQALMVSFTCLGVVIG